MWHRAADADTRGVSSLLYVSYGRSSHCQIHTKTWATPIYRISRFWNNPVAIHKVKPTPSVSIIFTTLATLQNFPDFDMQDAKLTLLYVIRRPDIRRSHSYQFLSAHTIVLRLQIYYFFRKRYHRAYSFIRAATMLSAKQSIQTSDGHGAYKTAIFHALPKKVLPANGRQNPYQSASLLTTIRLNDGLSAAYSIVIREPALIRGCTLDETWLPS